MTAMLPTGMTPGAVGIWTLVAVMVGALIKAWPALKKLQNESDQSLRDTLMARIETLEKRIDTMTLTAATEREFHSAEMGLMRHRLNNESQTVDALIRILRDGPDRAASMIPDITDQRARAADQFAREMNTINAARLAGHPGKEAT